MNIKENFSIFGLINFPVILTLLNLVSGIVSILFAISKEYTLACLFMIVAAFFDLIDGRMADYMKQQTPMRHSLDCICDVVSFGVAPVVLAFQTTKNLGEGWIFAVIIYVILLVAASLRLARFSISKHPGHFQGIPAVTNGVVVPVFYFIGLTSWYPLIFLVLSVFMISAFKIKRFF
ncbi:CDP-alcohol phosphatidyltransferase family protein [Candidatus Woesearchaeota archaeon]|nr:CDP-alcohol phosphatidyltransferase family protein [Candidatus Woesearchaeota archaeon]